MQYLPWLGLALRWSIAICPKNIRKELRTMKSQRAPDVQRST